MEVDELTDHQIAVLRLVASGRSNNEIAAAMDVSDKAVERTIQRISEALGLEASAGNRRVHLTRAYAELSGKDLPST
jgi:DNA-binding NarL/FixJ family response regulator